MNKRTLIIISIVVLAALSRLLPHAPNFTPMVAVALFAGSFLHNRVLALSLPVFAMLLSDALMGFTGWIFPEQVVTVYITYTLIAFLGTQTGTQSRFVPVGLSAIGSSVFFFLTTNFAVWMGGFFHTPALYPMNGAGLMECFAAAIPFFRNALVGDVFYTALLFGSFYLIRINIPALARD